MNTMINKIPNKKIISLLFFILIHILTTAQVRNFKNVGQTWKTDLTKHSVALNEFTALLKRDGIPPIDKPKFIKATEATNYYFEHEPVIAVVHKQKAKAYPLNILTYHEIVNDHIDDFYFSATYCPLCNAAIVFNRKFEFKGEKYLLDFGVSGMLRNSDLVMWDRQTETWWQQFLGEALVGKLTGAELEMIPAQIISISEFTKNHPGGEVLSKDTGFEQQASRYGTNVYEGYDSRDIPYEKHFTLEVDKRLPAMERVIDIQAGGEFKVYPHSKIAKKKVVNDSFNGLDLVLFYQKGTKSVMDTKDIKQAKNVGSITVFERIIENKVLNFKKYAGNFKDIETGSVWTITGKCIRGKLEGKQLTAIRYGNHFAFSWFAFHPESSIYGED